MEEDYDAMEAEAEAELTALAAEAAAAAQGAADRGEDGGIVMLPVGAYPPHKAKSCPSLKSVLALRGALCNLLRACKIAAAKQCCQRWEQLKTCS